MRILEARYQNFKTFQIKVDVDTIVFCLKNVEDNSIIFSIRVINISYLTAHFETTITMVSTNFKMNFIFDEWINDEHIALKGRGNFQS